MAKKENPMKLDVEITDKELGRGAYGKVVELSYLGLKCAGKKLHEELYKQSGNLSAYPQMRFEKECQLLCETRHPNIVQFLGVAYEKDSDIPILVLEYLPHNLTECISQFGVMPEDVNLSVLHDVALGLNYLHSHNPPIIHRDLTANNILLTASMTAKISDLGVAKMLNLTPLQTSAMTQTPGTPAYMPPEVFVDEPKYGTSVDEFSFGVLMIHVLSGEWPIPKREQIQYETDGKMTPVTEAERRKEYLATISQDHPLMDLIKHCLNNNPEQRVHADAILQEVKKAMSPSIAVSINRLELLRQTDNLESEVKRQKEVQNEDVQKLLQQLQLIEEAHQSEIQHLKSKIEKEKSELQEISYKRIKECQELKEQLRKSKEEHLAKIEKLELLHSTEVKMQNAETRKQLDAQIVSEKELRAKYEHALVEQKRENSQALEEARKNYSQEVEKQAEEHASTLAEKQERHEQELAAERSKCTQLIEEAKAANEANIAKMKQEREEMVLSNEKQINLLHTALENKQKTVQELQTQLSTTCKYLSSKIQQLPVQISWKQCSNYPNSITHGTCTVINDKVYYGGGETSSSYERAKYLIYRYNPLLDEWGPLTEVRVKKFGLGQIKGQLVTIGGITADGKVVNYVYAYDERAKKWRPNIPQLPTALYEPTTASHESALLVAGGINSEGTNRNTIDVFDVKSYTWHACSTDLQDAANVNSCHTSPCVLGDEFYLIGGSQNDISLNEVSCTILKDFARESKLSQSVSDTDAQNSITWKSLAKTPTYQPSATTLLGSLIALGGKEIPTLEGNSEAKVHVYSTLTDSWVYVGDLPSPRKFAATVALSPIEFIVIGGMDENNQMQNTVYKGTLEIKA